jgi:hypothetical protein
MPGSSRLTPAKRPPDTIIFGNGELQANGQTAPMSEVVEWLIEEGREPRLTYRYRALETRPLGQGGDMHFAFSYGVQATQVAVDEKNRRGAGFAHGGRQRRLPGDQPAGVTGPD